jgi:AhpD family alkylhydroperoxidase
MNGEFHKLIDQTDAYAVELHKLIPDTLKAFGGLARAAQTAGVLDRKTKELIALSISVSARCDACIAYHARGASRAGATRAEVAEALGVAVQMGGGPAVNYAATALGAFDELHTAETVDP